MDLAVNTIRHFNSFHLASIVFHLRSIVWSDATLR